MRSTEGETIVAELVIVPTAWLLANNRASRDFLPCLWRARFLCLARFSADTSSLPGSCAWCSHRTGDVFQLKFYWSGCLCAAMY